MGGVSDQRDPRGAPARQMRMDVERPAVTGVAVAGIDDGEDIRVPAREIRPQFFPRPFLGPGLLDALLQLDGADEVEQRAGAQEIDHSVLAGADPDGGLAVEETGRQAVHGHEQPPRRVACIARPVLAGDLPSDGRLDPVRADQEVSRDPLPAGKLQRDASPRLRESRWPLRSGGCSRASAPRCAPREPRGSRPGEAGDRARRGAPDGWRRAPVPAAPRPNRTGGTP